MYGFLLRPYLVDLDKYRQGEKPYRTDSACHQHAYKHPSADNADFKGFRGYPPGRVGMCWTR